MLKLKKVFKHRNLKEGLYLLERGDECRQPAIVLSHQTRLTVQLACFGFWIQQLFFFISVTIRVRSLSHALSLALSHLLLFIGTALNPEITFVSDSFALSSNTILPFLLNPSSSAASAATSATAGRAHTAAAAASSARSAAPAPGSTGCTAEPPPARY